MVENSVGNGKAAKPAGVPALAVLTGGFSKSELREAGAVQVVESIEMLDFASLFAESS
jgi:phosphoglycolate phosphatase-like HAD superfamily hydrolase